MQVDADPDEDEAGPASAVCLVGVSPGVTTIQFKTPTLRITISIQPVVGISGTLQVVVSQIQGYVKLIIMVIGVLAA